MLWLSQQLLRCETAVHSMVTAAALQMLQHYYTICKLLLLLMLLLPELKISSHIFTTQIILSFSYLICVEYIYIYKRLINVIKNPIELSLFFLRDLLKLLFKFYLLMGKRVNMLPVEKTKFISAKYLSHLFYNKTLDRKSGRDIFFSF